MTSMCSPAGACGTEQSHNMKVLMSSLREGTGIWICWYVHNPAAVTQQHDDNVGPTYEAAMICVAVVL